VLRHHRSDSANRCPSVSCLTALSSQLPEPSTRLVQHDHLPNIPIPIHPISRISSKSFKPEIELTLKNCFPFNLFLRHILINPKRRNPDAELLIGSHHIARSIHHPPSHPELEFRLGLRECPVGNVVIISNPMTQLFLPGFNLVAKAFASLAVVTGAKSPVLLLKMRRAAPFASLRLEKTACLSFSSTAPDMLCRLLLSLFSGCQ